MCTPYRAGSGLKLTVPSKQALCRATLCMAPSFIVLGSYLSLPCPSRGRAGQEPLELSHAEQDAGIPPPEPPVLVSGPFVSDSARAGLLASARYASPRMSRNCRIYPARFCEQQPDGKRVLRLACQIDAVRVGGCLLPHCCSPCPELPSPLRGTHTRPQLRGAAARGEPRRHGDA
jgi:hypothetical protein